MFVQHGHVKAHSWVRFHKPLRNGDSSEVTGAKLCVRNLALLTWSNRDLHPGKSENNYLVNLFHRVSQTNFKLQSTERWPIYTDGRPAAVRGQQVTTEIFTSQ